MNQSHAFASRVANRHRRTISAPGDPEVMAIEPTTIVLIITAVIAGCDAINPGWRDWITGIFGGIFGRSRPERERAQAARQARQLRKRADNARDPDAIGFFGRGQARNDRAMLLNHCRDRYPDARSSDLNDLVDAICDETADATDAEVVAVVAELARP